MYCYHSPHPWALFPRGFLSGVPSWAQCLGRRVLGDVSVSSAVLVPSKVSDIVLLPRQGLGTLIVVDPATVGEAKQGDRNTNPLAVPLLCLARLGDLRHPDVAHLRVLVTCNELCIPK